LNKYTKHIFAAAAGIIALILYIITLYPDVGFMDTGELAAACYSFGVPHPTGYPLFLLIGYIVSHLPLGGSVIYKLNMLSAVETALAGVVLFYTSFNLVNYLLQQVLSSATKKTASKQNKPAEKKDKKASEPESLNKSKNKISDFELTAYFLSFAGAMSFAFINTVWASAVQVEVYALHSLFLSLLMLYIIKLLINIKTPVKKDWAVTFLLLGLSFSNHLTTMFILPGILYLLYLQYNGNKEFFRSMLPLVLLVVPGLLFYALLVIASSYKPYLNWSDVSNISNLFDHLRGADYSQLMFSSTSKFGVNAAEFFKNLPAEFAYLPLIFVLTGFIFLWKVFRDFVVLSIFIILFNLVYAFNYNIVDINTYYLLVFILFVLTVPAGIIYLLSAGKYSDLIKTGNINSFTKKAAAAAVILTVLSAGMNFKSNNNSSNYANVDFTLNAINSVKHDAIIVAYDWAYLYSASLYYKQVENIRPDVKIFNIKFLAVDWYLRMIEKFYPDIYSTIKPEADEYLKVYNQSEKIKSPKLTALVSAFLDKNYLRYPVYITIDLLLGRETKMFLDNYFVKQDGLLFRLEPKNTVYDPSAGVNTLNYTFRKFEPDTKQKANMFKVIPGMYFETAYYHYNNRNFELSLKFINKALEYDPTFRDALNLRSRISQQVK